MVRLLVEWVLERLNRWTFLLMVKGCLDLGLDV